MNRPSAASGMKMSSQWCSVSQAVHSQYQQDPGIRGEIGAFARCPSAGGRVCRHILPSTLTASPRACAPCPLARQLRVRPVPLGRAAGCSGRMWRRKSPSCRRCCTCPRPAGAVKVVWCCSAPVVGMQRTACCVQHVARRIPSRQGSCAHLLFGAGVGAGGHHIMARGRLGDGCCRGVGQGALLGGGCPRGI